MICGALLLRHIRIITPSGTRNRFHVTMTAENDGHWKWCQWSFQESSTLGNFLTKRAKLFCNLNAQVLASWAKWNSIQIGFYILCIFAHRISLEQTDLNQIWNRVAGTAGSKTTLYGISFQRKITRTFLQVELYTPNEKVGNWRTTSKICRSKFRSFSITQEMKNNKILTNFSLM